MSRSEEGRIEAVSSAEKQAVEASCGCDLSCFSCRLSASWLLPLRIFSRLSSFYPHKSLVTYDPASFIASAGLAVI